MTMNQVVNTHHQRSWKTKNKSQQSAIIQCNAEPVHDWSALDCTNHCSSRTAGLQVLEFHDLQQMPNEAAGAQGYHILEGKHWMVGWNCCAGDGIKERGCRPWATVQLLWQWITTRWWPRCWQLVVFVAFIGRHSFFIFSMNSVLLFHSWSNGSFVHSSSGRTVMENECQMWMHPSPLTGAIAHNSWICAHQFIVNCQIVYEQEQKRAERAIRSNCQKINVKQKNVPLQIVHVAVAYFCTGAKDSLIVFSLLWSSSCLAKNPRTNRWIRVWWK